ncbi:MAG TPA: ribosome maturation factor RimM [Terracidiphilus sp.]|nr:ribosome maturation factor RimM [Terracidiphilus sp.]
MALEGWVWLARIKRTQGRKGEVFAEVLTDFPEKFSERRRLWLLKSSSGATGDVSGNAREVTLLHHWMHKGGVVLHFAGVDSICAAEELAGGVVAIPRAERAQLDEGDVYIGDLIGCTLIDIAGTEPVVVGEIEDVDRSAGPVAILVVKPARRSGLVTNRRNTADEEILIPFAKNYLRCLDVDGKRVEMALPEGLVDLNGAESS